MNSSGATEHKAERWQGALASANIGLPGKAFTAKKWRDTHAPRLNQQFLELLRMPGVLGLCLCEVGEIDDPITAAGKKNLTAVLQSTFAIAFGSSSLEGTPQIIWPTTESSTACAAWRGDVRIESLPSIKIPTLPDWRSIERMRLTSATEFEEQELMVYNTH